MRGLRGGLFKFWLRGEGLIREEGNRERGQISDFFSYTFFEITKKSLTKITKSLQNHIQKHKNHKSLQNY